MKLSKSLTMAAGLLLGHSAVAAPIVLDFEGVGDNAQILEFYNGGTDSMGNSGPDYDISFGGNALGLIDVDAGGSGNFANEPSPDTVMYFLSGTAILNYAAGFDTGFSFFYTSSTRATINIYDAVNATGNLIASIDLDPQYQDNNCTGDPRGGFCNWTAVGVAFTGTAKSIDFGGTQNQTGFDNITFGSATPGGVVPTPNTLALLALGLPLLGWWRHRKA